MPEKNAKKPPLNEPEKNPPATDVKKTPPETTFVYVGPSLPNSMLKSNTVLKGTLAEIKEYYKEPLTTYPTAAKLIVPVSKCAEYRSKAASGDNIVSTWYADVITAIRKGTEE
ncbi:MAG: hypothetical protein FWH20_00505 [Oscillospiraceae bacterium]|nr:hypothetical protein [Oscillospiraceae bacterium]